MFIAADDILVRDILKHTKDDMIRSACLTVTTLLYHAIYDRITIADFLKARIVTKR